MVQIEFVDDGLCVGFWRNVYVNVWRQQGNMTRLQATRRLLNALADRSPGGIAQFTVMETGVLSEPLNGAERAEATAIARELAPRTVAQAFVIEGSGFRAATTRMVISSVTTLSRPGYPHKTFAEVRTGAGWLASTAKLGEVADTLARCAAEVRARITSARAG